MTAQIPAAALIWLAAASLVLFLIPIGYALVWKKKGTLKAAPLLIGVLGFFLFAKVLETIPHIFCIVLDNPVSRFINGNAIVYMIYAALMAGIFEECGRYIMFRFFLKKDRSRECSISYGIGHGGFEVYIISFAATINYFIIGVMVNVFGVERGLGAIGVTDAAIPAYDAILSSIAAYDGISALVTVGERLLVVGIHITLSIIVFYGIKSQKGVYLFVAILAHAILDAPAALYQKGILNIWVVEGWLFLCLIILILYARVLYQKMGTEVLNDCCE